MHRPKTRKQISTFFFFTKIKTADFYGIVGAEAEYGSIKAGLARVKKLFALICSSYMTVGHRPKRLIFIDAKVKSTDFYGFGAIRKARLARF